MSEQDQLANNPKTLGKILHGIFFALMAVAVCIVAVYFFAVTEHMSVPKAALFLVGATPFAAVVFLVGHWWSKTETEKRAHLKTKILDVLKDYLELLRNLVFASSLLVIGGVVFYEHGLFKNHEVASRILECFVFASMLYATAAIYYLHWKHWPKHPAGQVGVVMIAMFLWVGMLQSLTVTAHHVDHVYAAQQAQLGRSSTTKEIKKPRQP
jgi:hypothetical protein